MTHDRAKTIIEDLEQTLLAFLRKHQISHQEYRLATDILVQTIKAGEESLLYDVFLEAEATDIGNLGRTGSPQALEGPFYLSGAPKLEVPFVLPQRASERGELLIFGGAVLDAKRRPLVGAELDFWQADADGLYSNIHPGIPDWNLRGRVFAGRDATFQVRTILPPPYEIPKNGPTGRVLNAIGRHFFRPAHLHVKVRHPGFEELTTQLYFEGGEYLESDVANGVREGLVIKLMRRERSSEKEEDANGSRPFYEVHYEFVLNESGVGA
jgi:catechol 1,2-dioxygenase